MYLDHFGLRAKPFRTTPDVDAFYPSTTHEAAISEVCRGIKDEEGLILVLGEPGTGKTLLAHRLIEGLPKKSRSVLLTNCHFRAPVDLLQNILFDLDLPYQEMSEQELRLALTESCLEFFQKAGPTIVVADEAHLLSEENLEELRLLSNLEGKEGKAIQVVLIGLPSLEQAIAQPALRIFRQRISIVCKLEPLNIEESADYLLHQIRWAGGRPETLLGDDVLDILSHASRGIPRLLNRAAHSAFSLAYQAGSDIVDAEAAVEAVTRLGLDDQAEEKFAEPIDEHEQEPEPEPPPPAPAAAAARETVAIPITPAPTVVPSHDGPPTYIYGGVEPNQQQRAG
jgi:type II secretory pathway predicted ATPase ExeA